MFNFADLLKDPKPLKIIIDSYTVTIRPTDYLFTDEFGKTCVDISEQCYMSEEYQESIRDEVEKEVRDDIACEIETKLDTICYVLGIMGERLKGEQSQEQISCICYEIKEIKSRLDIC